MELINLAFDLGSVSPLAPPGTEVQNEFKKSTAKLIIKVKVSREERGKLSLPYSHFCCVMQYSFFLLLFVEEHCVTR